MRLGIASNFDRRLFRIVEGHSSLAACESVFVSSEVGWCKPRVEFFRAIKGRLGARADEIALVGDDEVNDVQGAQAAGWTAVRLSRDSSCESENRIGTLAGLC
jgi:putative hydrolase of the HAD superfamily